MPENQENLASQGGKDTPTAPRLPDSSTTYNNHFYKDVGNASIGAHDFVQGASMDRVPTNGGTEPSGARLKLFFDDNTLKVNVEKKLDLTPGRTARKSFTDTVFPVNLYIVNEGAETATDIDCFIFFPKEVSIRDHRDMRLYWDVKCQSADKDNQETLESVAFVVSNIAFKLAMFPLNLNAISFNEFTFRKSMAALSGTRSTPGAKYEEIVNWKKDTSGVVKLKFGRMKMKVPALCETIYVCFPDWDSVTSFQLKYVISADE